MSTLGDKPETKEKLICKSSSLHAKEMTAEDLAPDGGWGWMVAAGMIVVQLVTFAQGSSFGLLFGDLFLDNDNGGAALTTINLLFMTSFCFSGLICKELIKKYSIKFVGTTGALVYATANTIVCLAPNVYYVALSFFAQGFGVGIMLTICTTSFNAYFFKRRTKVMGATQVITGLGPIVYPIVIEKLIGLYGNRATIALIGVISFNALVSMSIMDPVERHYKKPKKLAQTNGEKKDLEFSKNSKLLISEQKFGPIKRHSMDVAKSWEKNRSVQSLSAETEKEKPLLVETSKNPHRSHVSSTSGLDVEVGFRSKSEKANAPDLLSSRISMTGATSISSISGIAALSQIPETGVKSADDGTRRSLTEYLADVFEISLLRDGIYMNISIGCSILLLTDVLFGSFLPLILADEGYSKADVALTLTVAAMAELASKIFFTIFAMFFKAKSRNIYFGAAVMLCICKIIFLYCDTLTSKIIVNAFAACVRSWYMVTQSLIFAEYFSIEKFPAGWAIFTLINGCNAVIVLPVIGLLKDLTQSYVITQYILIGGNLLCPVCWTIEYLFVGCKRPETMDRK